MSGVANITGAAVAVVEEILDFLRTNYRPAPGEFSRFNQQRLVESLKLRELGKERGAKDQPAADAGDLDVVEQDIAEAMRQQALEDERRTREQLEHYTDRLKGANPAGQSSVMFLEAKNAVADFQKAMLSARTILDKARQSVIERDRQLADFKLESRLKRPPNPPKGHWLMSAVLLGAFCLEVGVNSSVLSAGSEFGILGGIVGAFFYTAVSMAASGIAGFLCLTHLNHAKWIRKVVGGVGFLILLSSVIGVNLLAAHYRIAITSGLPEAEAAKRAAQTLFGEPWLFLADMQSILMVCLSLIIAFVTMMEGLFWQDPYPGYAKVAKYRQQAYTRWVGAIEEHSDELEDIYQVYSDRIRALQASLADRQMMIPQILGNRRRLVINFNSHLQHIQDVGRYLIANYREANCETRKSAKPKYFTRSWKLDAVAAMDLPDDSDAGDPNAWKDVGEELRAASNELHAAHADAVKWIRQLGSSESALHVDAALASEQRKATEVSSTVQASEGKTDISTSQVLLNGAEGDHAARA
jgi:hypothetical protein